jgi:anti-sigma factor ChrR (cupin superfamily)
MHPNETAINAYAEGSLDPFERREIEQHLSSCASCQQLADDLREVLRATKTLELREPPVRAWSRLERAIKLEREAENGRALPGESSGRKRGSAPYWLAAAAALVLATAIGLRFMPAAHNDAAASNQTGANATIAAGDAAQSVETELRQAEAHYEKAIKGLEQIASSEQNALDPATAATLQKNLAVIDQAISESRAAVHLQPTSEPAQQSLIENFKMKMGLLQNTVALINEMRKGNESGASRIVSELKQKGN